MMKIEVVVLYSLICQWYLIEFVFKESILTLLSNNYVANHVEFFLVRAINFFRVANQNTIISQKAVNFCLVHRESNWKVPIAVFCSFLDCEVLDCYAVWNEDVSVKAVHYHFLSVVSE